MSSITIHGFFLNQYITEQSNELVRFRIPENIKIKIDEKALMAQFEEIRSVDVCIIYSNGDTGVVIWLKQNELSACGRIMRYR